MVLRYFSTDNNKFFTLSHRFDLGQGKSAHWMYFCQQQYMYMNIEESKQQIQVQVRFNFVHKIHNAFSLCPIISIAKSSFIQIHFTSHDFQQHINHSVSDLD